MRAMLMLCLEPDPRAPCTCTWVLTQQVYMGSQGVAHARLKRVSNTSREKRGCLHAINSPWEEDGQTSQGTGCV